MTKDTQDKEKEETWGEVAFDMGATGYTPAKVEQTPKKIPSLMDTVVTPASGYVTKNETSTEKRMTPKYMEDKRKESYSETEQEKFSPWYTPGLEKHQRINALTGKPIKIDYSDDLWTMPQERSTQLKPEKPQRSLYNWDEREPVTRPKLKREKALKGEEEFKQHGLFPTRKPSMIPDKYTDKTSWKDYKVYIEQCAQLNNWEEQSKAKYLGISLTGTAQKVLTTAMQKGEITYEELVKKLEERFGPGGQTELYAGELRNRERRKDETLQELGEAIRELTSLAYPELNIAAQERLAKQYFHSAIPDRRIRDGIFRVSPKTIDEAIRAAVETESYLKSGDGRTTQRGPKYGRVVDTEWQKEYEDINDKIENMNLKKNEEREKRTNYGNRQIQQDRWLCFRCGGKGHMKRDCPSPQWMEGNGQRLTQRAGVMSMKQKGDGE